MQVNLKLRERVAREREFQERDGILDFLFSRKIKSQNFEFSFCLKQEKIICQWGNQNNEVFCLK